MKRGTCNAEEDGGCEAETDPCSGWRRLVSDNVRLALLCFAAGHTIVITLSRNIFCTSVSFVQPLVCNCGHVRLLLKKYIVIHLRVDFIFLKAEHEWSICSPRKFPQMVASSRFTTLQHCHSSDPQIRIEWSLDKRRNKEDKDEGSPGGRCARPSSVRRTRTRRTRERMRRTRIGRVALGDNLLALAGILFFPVLLLYGCHG